jgi:tRNA-dihydrouridine synthase C
MDATAADTPRGPWRPRPPGVLALAPMDGVTDHVYRELVTARARKGRIAFCVSEFLRVTDRPMPDSMIRRSCPEVEQHGATRAGVPVMLQLLGGQPEPLAETARRAVRLGAVGIDLNFGCPAKTVNRHDGGASLLRCPERIERIVDRVRAVVPADRPVSVKIRLGWESPDEVVPIALAAERGGASWLTIHGRTKKDMYGPPANWAAIGRARAAVGIPVVANGDLNALEDLDRCGVATGCSHFMLGRGPMGRPSIVCGEEGAGEEAETRLLADMLLEYVEHLARSDKAEDRQIARVKQWLSLGSTANPSLTPLFDRVKRLRTRAELGRALRD